MPSYLVIGGAGNLGSHVIRCLRDAASRRVVCYDLTASGEVESIIGDVNDSAALQAAMAGIDTVFHLASIIDIRPVPSPRQQHVNVSGTACVVAACQAAGVKALVYTASLEVISGRDAATVEAMTAGT